NLLTNTEVSNGLITTSPQNTPYKTLIVPATQKMPLATLKKIIAMVADGATVIFQSLPQDVPGLTDYQNRHNEFSTILSELSFKENASGLQEAKVGKGKVLVSANINAALAKEQIDGEDVIKSGLKFIRRKVENGTFYYVVNHSAKDVDEFVSFNSLEKEVVLLDPQNGSFGRANTRFNNGKRQVRLQLKSGEAAILKFAEDVQSE